MEIILSNEKKEELVGMIFHQLSAYGYLNEKGNIIANDSNVCVPLNICNDIIDVINSFIK